MLVFCSTERYDMGGTGSFMTQNRTLYVGQLSGTGRALQNLGRLGSSRVSYLSCSLRSRFISSLHVRSSSVSFLWVPTP